MLPTMSVPYTGEVILISQKCCPWASSLEPRMAAVPQLYSVWKLTFRLSQLSRVALDLPPSSHTQSKSAAQGGRERQGGCRGEGPVSPDYRVRESVHTDGRVFGLAERLILLFTGVGSMHLDAVVSGGEWIDERG